MVIGWITPTSTCRLKMVKTNEEEGSIWSGFFLTIAYEQNDKELTEAKMKIDHEIEQEKNDPQEVL
jgi:hypothetical protein